jgi:adenosine deaminase
MHLHPALMPPTQSHPPSCSPIHAPVRPPNHPQDFLDIYLACTDALVTEEDFYELARDYLARAAAENVRGAEVFLDAQGHMARCAALQRDPPGGS